MTKLPLLIVFLFVIVACGTNGACGALPNFADLLREAYQAQDQAANETGSETSWGLDMLAAARAYSGDLAGAFQAAAAIKSEVWRGIAQSDCFDAAMDCADRSRPPPSIPDDATQEARSFMLQRLAKEYIKRSDLPSAAATVQQFDKSYEMPWNEIDLHLLVGLAHLDRMNRKEALREFAEAFRIAETPGAVVTHVVKTYSAIANAFAKADDLTSARKAIATVQNLTLTEFKNEPTTVWTASRWAEVGEAWHAIGENQKSAKAFDIAARMALEVPEEADNATAASAWASVGSSQWRVGRIDDARRSFERSIRAVERADRDRDYELSQIAEIHARAGDVNGANTTLARIHDSYWAAMAHCQLATVAHHADRLELAAEYLAAAISEISRVEGLGLQVDVCCRIAEQQSEFGEMDQSGRSLHRALEIVKTESDPHQRLLGYQSIARAQVKTGQLEPAYETIAAMGPSTLRAAPLAELALAMAKRDARKSRTNRDARQ